MSKIKLLITLLIANCLLFAGVTFVNAATVYIQSLPGYINYTDFKLSCSSNGNTAQFYSKKDGGSYTAFGPSINLTTTPCQVQVTGAQFGSEGKFYFKVEVDGASSETSTTLDTTAPGTVSDFGKSRMGGGMVYRIQWKNPNDSDYAKVFIYRGTEAGFESDGKKIAEAGGNPGDMMSWDDNGLDPNKEYYYYVRAIDKAGNGSGLVGDSSTTTVTATPAPGTSGAVTILPREQGTGGSILGAEDSPTTKSAELGTPDTGIVNQINEFAGKTPEPFKWILTHKKISLGIAIILGLLAYNFYRYSRKSNTL